jgi:uncharacterized membrane protein
MNKPYEDIQQYLKELQNALQGQSAGLVQDALYDVENHFLEASANDKDSSVDALIDAFGYPKEIATQYIQLEEDSKRYLYCSDSNKPMFNGFFESLACFKNYKSLIYFFISLPLSIVYFGWVMLFGVPALILSLVVVGLPFLALFLKTQAYLALIEGQLISAFLGVRMPRRPGRIALSNSSKARSWKGLSETLKSPHCWRIVFYSVLHLPLSATYFFAVCVLFVGSLALMVSPLVDPLIHAFAPHLTIDINLYWLPVTAVVGVIGVTLSMHIARLLATLHSSIASYLLIQR